MTALSLANLGGGGSSFGEALRKASSPQSASAFEDALARQGAVPPADPSQVATVSPPADAPVKPVEAASETDAAGRERVRRSLDLDGAAAPSSGGDAILGGLQKLRGVFDQHHTHISSIMHTNVVDTDALMAMQMEMAQYTILIDVSSKLTGKTTQSLDTLMKGQ